MSSASKEDAIAAMKHGLQEVERLATAVQGGDRPARESSARDILAHMAFWEARVLDVMRLVPEGREDELLHPEDEAEIDAWNERVQRENQGTSWGMALRYWSDLRRTTIKELAAMEPSVLSRGYRGRDFTVIEQIAADTYEHDEEHLPQLRALAGEVARG
ncbi:MAG: hypothetical protein GEU28_00755 [Dehalococcoidia bacterium]|nr:hypothetical protein [Dehalococcoidia bacterium]